MNSLTHSTRNGKARNAAGFVTLAWPRPAPARESGLRRDARSQPWAEGVSGDGPPAEELDPFDDFDNFDELDWPPAAAAPRAHEQAQAHEWLFWSFLMCMALVALPLVGARWTTPDGALRGAACAQTLLWALPVVLALPALLVGCIAELAFRPAARTAPALLSFAAALGMALAGVLALLA